MTAAVTPENPDTPIRPGRVGVIDRLFAGLLRATEAVSALVLVADVLVVFWSVIARYFLHSPVDWAEEVARGLLLLLVFLGSSRALALNQHMGIDSVRGLLPVRLRPYVAQACLWAIVLVAAVLIFSGFQLMFESRSQITSMGLPQAIFVAPVCLGGILFFLFGLRAAMAGPPRVVWRTCAVAVVSAVAMPLLYNYVPEALPSPVWWLLIIFVGCMLAGVPIAFSLALSSAIYFVLNPTIPVVIYSQQVSAGSDHFVLLAIPFFVLAGLVMEVNGMSSRLIELLVRIFGRIRGGVNLIIIFSMAFFSGISGSKLADVAAVGAIMMPAVRRCKQDENEAAALLASSAVMAETIPPCINMIVFGFVANVSIGGLFIAGLLPAALLALGLAVIAVVVGERVDPDLAYPGKRRMSALIGGAAVGLIMILMISKGVMSGVATATEMSAFAVVYALIVGGLAFRELTWRNVYKLFVDSATLAGMILFIVAAASSLSYALTIEQIPQMLGTLLVEAGHSFGVWAFMLISVLLLIVFGAVLEGVPALIIFGPLLTPIATQLGVHPLHYGTVLVIAMGFGMFAPPLGLGLYTTCAVTGTRMGDVVMPMLKYFVVLLAGLLLVAFVPGISLMLPAHWGFR